MIAVHRPPSAALSGLVELYWYYAGWAPGHARERLLPSGSMELIFDLTDETRGDAFLVGAQSGSVEIDTSRPQTLLGVHFKPGGAFAFLRPPADAFRDEEVTLHEVWGSLARELRERFLETRDPEAMFRLLEATLLRQRVRDLARHPAVEFALRSFQQPLAPKASDVGEATGLSSRRFIELFKQQVGLTPKLFSRIRRFQRVLRLTQPQADVDWSDVAFDCGYFDQAHFIHDFRGFSGLTPTAYLALRSDHLNHVALPD